MVTVAALIRKLQEMPQDAPFAVEGDNCGTRYLAVKYCRPAHGFDNGVVSIVALDREPDET
jgi:hypothetical protein